MNCAEVRGLMAGYLDGAWPASRANDHGRVGHHLESCADCREELEHYRKLSALMARVERPAPPVDLAARIRVRVSESRAESSRPRALAVFGAKLRRWSDHCETVLKNILEPLALPVSGGLAVALTVFVIVGQVLGLGTPLQAVTNDAPTNLLQPARLETLASFPMTGIEDASHGASHVLVVEATVSANGEAASYRILSGPTSDALRRELDQVMLFSRFRPELSFGRPTDGGHVVLSFSEYRVRG
jgi:anti-sigma factor RsiW